MASTPSSSQAPAHKPPKLGRSRRRLVIAALLLVAIGAALVWRLRPQRRSFYTDADRIRAPVGTALPRDVLWQPPVRLPDTINSPADDYEPRLSADGMALFFVRGKAGENADIYFSRRIPTFDRDPPATAEGSEAGQESAAPLIAQDWSDPGPLSALNSSDDDLGPEPSIDGNTLYFYSNRSGGSGGYDLWMAQRHDDGWLPPVNLGPQVNSPFNDYGPSLSTDGGTLYFASNRPQPQDGEQPDEDAWTATVREDLFKRDYDLFAAPVTERGTGEAAPLDALNTAYNEGAPAVSPAGDFLYFASDRPGGQGGFDAYRSRRLRGAFQAPTNLGPEVNTASNELDPALSLGGFALHFSSDRPCKPLPAGARPDYELYQTTSREVFTEDEIEHVSIDWAGLWRDFGPSLLLALLSLILLLLLLKLLGGLRNRALSLIVRCLLASVFLHLLLLFLLTFWEVTASIAGAIQRRGGTKVALVSPTQGREIENQILGALIDVRLEAIAARPAQAAPPRPEMETPASSAMLEPQARLMQSDGRTLVEHAATDAPIKPPDAAQPPEIQSAVTLDPVTLRLPAVAEATKTTETVLGAAPAVPIATTPDSTITHAISQSMNAQSQTVSVAPATIAAATQTALPLMQSPSDTTDAAPLIAPSAVKVPLVEGTAEMPAPNLNLPRTSSGTVAKPDQPFPAPQAVALVATQAAPAGGHSHAAPGPGLDDPRLEPRAIDVPATSTGSLVNPDADAADAAPAFVAQSLSTAESLAPPPAPAAEIRLPPTRQATAAAPRAEPGSPAPPNSTPAVRQAPSVAALGREMANDIEVVLAPAEADARPKSVSSLARAAVTPSEAAPALAAATHSIIEGTDSLPQSLDPSLRLPTDLLPPENPYAQRQAQEKQDIVNRMGGSEKTERGVAAALVWLAEHQGQDGRWDGNGFDRRCGECGGETDLEVDVGLTGLSLLCFLGANHTHQKDGPYRDHVDRAVSWLISLQNSDGDLRRDETMYSHGIAAIALSEAYGMTRDARLEVPVQRAIQFIEEARNPTAGGWRYDPGQVGDTSVLGWQVMALKSAQMAGITVNAETFAAAGAWLEKVSSPARPGLYAYQPQRKPSHAMTAEGMFVQQLLGRPHDEPRMIASAAHLAGRLPDWNATLDTYYWYYATMALYQHSGDGWEQWNEALTRELLAHQVADGRPAGSWAPRGKWADKGGRVYQTALCTLMLEVYYRYLPLYSVTPGDGVAKP